jgi:hypothetical protein
MRRISVILLIFVWSFLGQFMVGQNLPWSGIGADVYSSYASTPAEAVATTPAVAYPSDRSAPALVPPVSLPRMSPELALVTYQRRAMLQSAQLSSYSATTVIDAQLPDMAQSGEYEIERRYAAPRTLEFKAVQYTGDGFVKSNVIIRLLQSEVDHVQKDAPSLTSVSPANYKFSYKGISQLSGHTVHMYNVKPRGKRAGLFKGRIFLDAYTGSLVRAEGSVVKSPSFFVKKIEFVQDYADFGSFTFPVHIHSVALARIVGRTVVDIYHRNYQPIATLQLATEQLPTL